MIDARGVPVRLYVSSSAEAAIVAQRINEAMIEQRAIAAAAVQARLDRHGRDIGTWLRDVRAQAGAATGYREAMLDPEELALVLVDGAAPAERRIAAAAGLARDEAGRQRVRIAAEACADDRLQAALAEAAEAEIDEARIRPALG